MHFLDHINIVTLHGPHLQTLFLQDYCNIIFQTNTLLFPVALRPDSGSWPSLIGLRDHTHSTNHTRQESSGQVISPMFMPLTGFEPAIPVKERPQTHVLDRAATRTDKSNIWSCKYSIPFRFAEQN